MPASNTAGIFVFSPWNSLGWLKNIAYGMFGWVEFRENGKK